MRPLRSPSLHLLAALAVATVVQTARAQTPSSHVASLGTFGGAEPRAHNPEPDAVVLELRIGDIASITVPGYRVGDEALIPLSALLRLAEVQHTLHAHGTVEATFQPGNVQLIASPDHDVMSYATRRVRLARDLRLFRGGELYVSVAALGELLQLPLEVDWADLTVRFTEPKSLPIARRVAREAARRRLSERIEGPGGPAMLYALRRPPLDGLVLDYTVSAPSTDLKASRYSFAAGMNAFGGSLEGTFVGMGTQGTDYTAAWTGVWATNDWLRQARVGDALSSGRSPRPLRGATVTNSPYIRPTRFGVDGFRGVVAPHWEIEAYRAGQLVAFDSTDASGRYDIPIPTEYGENPLEFVAYGPFGEVRHFNRLYRVAGELVPAGQFEYGISAGQCISLRCVGTGNLDLRYGMSPRWTVRAGYDAFQRDSLPMLSHPYAGVAGALTDAIGVQIDAAMGASARALLRYEPSTRMRFAGEYTRFDASDSIPILTPAGWRARWLVSALARPLGSASAMYVEGDAAHIETISGRTLRARLITSGQWRDLRVSPYARFEQDAGSLGPAVSRSYFGVNAAFFPRTSSRLFGRAWLHASFEAEQKTGLSQASVSVTRQFGRGVRIEAGGRWSRNSAVVTLLSAIDLAAVRSYTTAWIPKSGTPTTSQFLQGSIVVNTAAKAIALEAGPSLHRSGIAGRVFLDENSNGRLDVNEQLLSNVTVRVGATASQSDSKGRFEVWNLTAYDPALVTVDSSSLTSPLWIPRFATVTVVPGPNRFVLVDVPIVPSGSVEGRVVLETPAGRRAIGSAILTLVDKQAGVKQTVTTFSDGEFVAIGVRPGRYEVTVDDRLLRQLEATAAPTRFTLEASAEGTTIRGIEVVLRRSDPAR